MDGKVFVGTYIDGRDRVFGDGRTLFTEPLIEGRWVDFSDPCVQQAEWGAWEAEEITES